MELADFQAVVGHLSETLPGAKVEACLPVAPGVIGIELRQGRARQHLLFGIRADCSGLALQSHRPPSGLSASIQRFNPRFAGALTHTIAGYHLAAIELPRSDDRIARFTFSKTDRYGEEKRRVLQLELTGRTSQLFLLNEREQLISSLRQLDYRHQRERPLKTGEVLPPPPPPPLLTAEGAEAAAAVDVSSVLKRERDRFRAFFESTRSASPATAGKRRGAAARRERLVEELTLARQAGNALRALGEADRETSDIVPALREATGEDFVAALIERGHLAEPFDLGKLIRALQRMAASQEKLRQLLASLSVEADAISEKVSRKAESPDPFTARLKSFPHKLRRGTTSSGFPLILTFSAEGNYAALKAFGSPEHWFFHARDFAGSYVLLLTGKSQPKHVDIRQAALVAAIHSKGKRQAKVEVSYTQLKHVHKPKHARTGTVLMTREQVITVRTEEWERVKGKLFG